MEQGQVYEMQYLTDLEKALINAYRNGANINVFIDNIKDIDSAIEKINEFGPVSRFSDYKNHISVTNWSAKSYPNPSVYVHLDKECM